MREMDAAILYGKEDVRMERIPIPAVEPGEIRIRIRAALTCGTDVKVYRRGYHARMLKPPCVFGHEFAGDVDAVGEGISNWKIGDRAAAANSAPCGECFFCRRGQPELCEDHLFLNGAFAQYITVPERIVRANLVRIPSTLRFEEAALIEPLACVLHGAEESSITRGESVVIIGGGAIGLLFIRVCSLLGAEVVSISRTCRSHEAAYRMGARTVAAAEAGESAAKALNGGRGADKVIECVGRPETWEQAVRLVRKGGLVNFFGGCPAGTTVSLDADRVHYDALTLRGTFHHTPNHIRRALEMLSFGQIPADVIITDSAPLQQTPEILRKLAQGDSNLKVAILPDH